MERQLPQPGELWQHFKGHKYWIAGIGDLTGNNDNFVIYVESLAKILSELSMYQSFIVKNSEQEKYYEVRFFNNKWFLYSTFLINKDSLGWARPLEMFMESLDDSRDGGFRFTKLDLETICSKQK